MTPVEKVLDVIRIYTVCQPWAMGECSKPNGDDHCACLSAAQAAIAALSEPSDAMRAAALNVRLPGAGDPPLYEMVFRAMIDQALKEEWK